MSLRDLIRFPSSDEEWDAFWETYWSSQRKRRRYSGPRGVTIPGIHKRNFHRRSRKMRAYERPRKGGGTSKRNESDY